MDDNKKVSIFLRILCRALIDIYLEQLYVTYDRHSCFNVTQSLLSLSYHQAIMFRVVWITLSAFATSRDTATWLIENATMHRQRSLDNSMPHRIKTHTGKGAYR